MGIILYVIFIYNHIYKTLFRMISQNAKVPQILGSKLIDFFRLLSIQNNALFLLAFFLFL